MNREIHVRFCEGLGVKLPRPTHHGTGLVIIAKRLERSLFAKINPYQKDDIVLTQAEFGLFFEGADLTKRFIDSPAEVKKTARRQTAASAAPL